MLGFLGLSCTYAMQVDLNVTVLAMSKNTHGFSKNGTKSFVECPMLVEVDDKPRGSKYLGQRYDWSYKEQAIILGSFYYGYLLTLLPGGYLAQAFSAKWVFGLGIFFSGLLSLLTPTVTAMGAIPLVILRILQGLFQGVTKPAINAIISRWSPKLERSRFSTFTMSGGLVGSVIAMPLSGVISSCATLGGWPTVFSFFGILSCIWFIFWICFISDTPLEHPSISPSELMKFDQSIEEIGTKKRVVPWKAIFTSLPVWAVIVAHFGSGFGFLALFTELPNFMENVLHFNIRENGEILALPYIIQALAAWMASYFADHLRKTGNLSITTIRKIFNSIGTFGPAFFMLCVTVSGCRPKLIIGWISLAMAFNGFCYSGYNVTHVDMSPYFASTLFGLTSTIAFACGIFAPTLVGFLTADKVRNFKQINICKWRKVSMKHLLVYQLNVIDRHIRIAKLSFGEHSQQLFSARIVKSTSTQ
ncbi:hypothetical protein NPIL_324571 [Nephila pilipes]|uniref:Major facilitator superfamily (MFS) profile domain-containing protein n=1 Tax=Nephila pilipes TaxID=299642 RepID=A0A8X6NQ96_NEPPI|nr:hypothetical protein NPIL_47241 [Nephila pilipes]GFT27832.1 hypothetical protein NPIL_324571 [Nephila pilipes]